MTRFQSVFPAAIVAYEDNGPDRAGRRWKGLVSQGRDASGLSGGLHRAQVSSSVFRSSGRVVRDARPRSSRPRSRALAAFGTLCPFHGRHGFCSPVSTSVLLLSSLYSWRNKHREVDPLAPTHSSWVAEPGSGLLSTALGALSPDAVPIPDLSSWLWTFWCSRKKEGEKHHTDSYIIRRTLVSVQSTCYSAWNKYLRERLLTIYPHDLKRVLLILLLRYI